MDQFKFCVPKIEFGVGITKNICEYVKKYKGTKILVVTDKGVKKAGIVSPITEVLTAGGFTVTEFDKVMPDPSSEIVDELVSVGMADNTDIVIAIGGGSVMDAAKAAKMILTNGGKCMEYSAETKGMTPFANRGLPFIAIPTTSGTGSEISPCSVITDTCNQHKYMIADMDKMYADTALLDPELMIGLPASVTAACGMDVMSHAVEAYFSEFATPFTDPMSLYAIRLCAESLPKAVKNGSDLQARANMAIACTIAAIGVSNANASLGHGMAHAMGAAWHISHGVACGLALPYVFQHISTHKPERALAIADALGCSLPEHPSPEQIRDVLVKKIRSLIREIQIPSARELGHDLRDLDTIMRFTKNEWALCQMSGCEFTEKDCRNYYTDILSR